METNKPDVVGYINELGLDRLRSDDCGYVQIYARQLPEHSELPKRLPLIRLSDYEALQAECDALRAKTSLSLGVGDGTGNLFVHGDYDSIKRVQELVFECEELRTALDAHKAARIAYASEFPLGADGTPDVGSIHENIRMLKARSEKLVEALARCRQQASYTIGGTEALQNQLYKIRDITNEALAAWRQSNEL